jgi:hypothetical protein
MVLICEIIDNEIEVQILTPCTLRLCSMYENIWHPFSSTSRQIQTLSKLYFNLSHEFHVLTSQAISLWITYQYYYFANWMKNTTVEEACHYNAYDLFNDAAKELRSNIKVLDD